MAFHSASPPVKRKSVDIGKKPTGSAADGVPSQKRKREKENGGISRPRQAFLSSRLTWRNMSAHQAYPPSTPPAPRSAAKSERKPELSLLVTERNVGFLYTSHSGEAPKQNLAAVIWGVSILLHERIKTEEI